MRLNELSPQFLKCEDSRSWRCVAMRSEADGIKFLCPKCFAANGGPVGTHSVICWQPSVPEEVRPGPGRWTMQGDSYDELTLVAGSSSIKLESGCMAHFFVTKGEIKSA